MNAKLKDSVDKLKDRLEECKKQEAEYPIKIDAKTDIKSDVKTDVKASVKTDTPKSSLGQTQETESMADTLEQLINGMNIELIAFLAEYKEKLAEKFKISILKETDKAVYNKKIEKINRNYRELLQKSTKSTKKILLHIINNENNRKYNIYYINSYCNLFNISLYNSFCYNSIQIS